MNARLRMVGCGVSLGVLLLAAAPAEAGGAPVQTLHGTFSETATGASLGYDIHGSAKLTVSDDSTIAEVNVSGLPELEYPYHYGSHLHTGLCSASSPGGGHYKVTPTGGTGADNELWLSTPGNPRGAVDPNPGGVAHASGSATWEARLTGDAAARSIVVHAPDGAKIACADLS